MDKCSITFSRIFGSKKKSFHSFVLELTEDVMEDTTVLIVSNFGISVKTALNNKRLAAVGSHFDVLADLHIATLSVDVEVLRAIEAEMISVLTFLELKGQDAHADKVGTMDTFVGLSNDSLNTLQVGALSSPIAGRAGTVLFTSHDNGVVTSLDVLVGSIEDSHILTRGDVLGVGTSLVNHLVDKTNVGESTTGHDLVVTAAGAVGVVVLLSDSAFSQVAGSGRVFGDLTSG